MDELKPEPPKALIDAEWLAQIKNRDDKTFVQFCAENQAEKKMILEFTMSATPKNPDERDKDNDKCVAYLARASWLHSKAGAFNEKAKGIVPWLLKQKGLQGWLCQDVAPAFIADFKEEVQDWEALLDSLHERLWTGRGEVKKQNRPNNF